MVPLLALILMLLPQGDTGQLSGTIVDPNNASIPNAKIKLINQSTTQSRDLITKHSGDFAFTLLPPGSYKLEVTANGFNTVQIDDLRISPSTSDSHTLGWGSNLAVVYLVWIAGVLILCPLCNLFVGVKQRRRDWWLSYL